MPRPPKSILPLRLVRKAAKKTQAQFASLIGVKEVTVRRLEGGSLTMSARLARRIEAATGADASELQKGAGGQAIAIGGGSYTEEVFALWQKRLMERQYLSPQERARDLSFWTGIVVEASGLAGPAKFDGVCEAIIETLETVVADYALASYTKRPLERFKRTFIGAHETFTLDPLFDPRDRAVSEGEKFRPAVYPEPQSDD